MNWLSIFGLAVELGSDVLADEALIAADQPVTSPSVDVTIDGNKYAATLNLSPVPKTA